MFLLAQLLPQFVGNFIFFIVTGIYMDIVRDPFMAFTPALLTVLFFYVCGIGI